MCSCNTLNDMQEFNKDGKLIACHHPHIPNAETIKALESTEDGETMTLDEFREWMKSL